MTIDHDDNNAILFDIWAGQLLVQKARLAGILPPEWHPADEQMAREPVPYADIFQLGLLLWLVCAGQDALTETIFCTIAACPKSHSGACDAMHANPVAQPPLPDDIPDCMNEIIALCRLQERHRRLQASRFRRRLDWSSLRRIVSRKLS